MKRIITAILFILLFNSMVLGGSLCVCQGAINSAFNKIDKNIIQDNLSPLLNNLKKYKSAIKKNNESIKKYTKQQELEIKRLKALVLETEKYLYRIRTLKEIKKMPSRGKK